MTNSFNIMKQYNTDKFEEIVEFLKIAKLNDLLQKKYVLLYNLNSLEDFNDLTNEDAMELQELFKEANNKVLVLLEERIKFLQEYNISNPIDIKPITENDIITSILKQFEDLIKYIEIYKGSLKTNFYVLMIDSFLIGLSKLYVWYQNQLNKIKL